MYWLNLYLIKSTGNLKHITLRYLRWREKWLDPGRQSWWPVGPAMLALTAVWNSSRRTIVSSSSTTLSTPSKVGKSCRKCLLHLDLYQVLCIRSLSSGCRSLQGRRWHSSRRILPTRFELFIKVVLSILSFLRTRWGKSLPSRTQGARGSTVSFTLLLSR